MRSREVAYILCSFALLAAIALIGYGVAAHEWRRALVVCAVAVVGTAVALTLQLRQQRARR